MKYKLLAILPLFAALAACNAENNSNSTDPSSTGSIVETEKGDAAVDVPEATDEASETPAVEEEAPAIEDAPFAEEEAAAEGAVEAEESTGENQLKVE